MANTLERTATSIATARPEWDGQLSSGGWRAPSGGTIDVLEKATGEPLATVGLADATDVARAGKLAAAAQVEWAATSFEERAAILRRAADVLEAGAPDVIDWLVRETGEIRARATHEVRISVGEIREAAALAGQPYGELLPTTERGRLSFAQRVPVGVVGAITPWNAPVILGIRVIAPALALGNAVVIKPDAQTPLTGGLLLASIFEEAGLPEGVLHALPGAAEAGEALVVDPHTRLISFTGSTATGRRVGELAGRHLKKVSLELGGNNALVVLDDADLEGAASSGAWGSFLHQGQLCFSTGRHLVQASVADVYAEAITVRAEALAVGDPFREDVALGPIINQRQLDRFDAIVRDTVSAGARLRTGGTHEQLFYRPTVIDGVQPAMRAFAEEIFGPVAAVTTFDSDAEAIELANRSEYGLTAAIYTSDLARGLDVARAMRAGMVHVNDTTINDQAIAPFGGMGASGNGGRFGSLANWEEFTQWQWCTVRDRAPRFAF
jgi:benzaldehyde dehydrogenase (NAD)